MKRIVGRGSLLVLGSPWRLYGCVALPPAWATPGPQQPYPGGVR
jgi:hypothetical protein